MTLLSNDWDLEEITSLRGFSVEVHHGDSLIVSRRNKLFGTSLRAALTSNGSQPPLERLGSFPASPVRRAISASRLAQRALRFMFYNVVPLTESRLFCSFAKSVAIIGGEASTETPPLHRPARILRGGCALTDDGTIYFGEYLSNSERSPIRVYRYRMADSTGLEVAHLFDEREIRHVHGIYWDPYTQSLWCTCGDIGDECRILRFDESFKLIEVVGSGDESWRAVSLLFTPDAVYYGMDAEFTENYLYRIDRGDHGRTRITELEGPVYYSTANASGLFFGVTAELCPSQSEPVASIWHVSENGAIRLAKSPKDRWSPGYGMPGTIHFPRSDGRSTDLLYSTVAVKEDNRVYHLRPRVRSNLNIPA